MEKLHVGFIVLLIAANMAVDTWLGIATIAAGAVYYTAAPWLVSRYKHAEDFIREKMNET